jgi:hypothetical protein
VRIRKETQIFPFQNNSALFLDSCIAKIVGDWKMIIDGGNNPRKRRRFRKSTIKRNYQKSKKTMI